MDSSWGVYLWDRGAGHDGVEVCLQEDPEDLALTFLGGLRIVEYGH